MDVSQWLGALSRRAKTSVQRGRRHAARGDLPLTVGETMTRHVGTARIEDMLSKPASIMWERDCGIVPILDASEHVVGVITDRDISMAALTQGQPLQSIAVSTAMSRNLIAVSSDDTIDVAEALMAEHQVRRLPVIDDGRLVGVLSVGDLLRQVGSGATNYFRAGNGRRGRDADRSGLAGSGKGRKAKTVRAAHQRLLGVLSDICQPRSSDAPS